jgi:tetratricopeptide (TPR) repeat protein
MRRVNVNMRLLFRFFVSMCILASLTVLASARPAGQYAQPGAAQQQPLTEKEIIQLIKKNKKQLDKIAPEVQQRGVAFEMTPQIEDELRKAGADDAFVGNIKNYGPTARAAKLTGGGGAVNFSTPEEGKDFRDINDELDPDRKIQLVKDFAQKYPNSGALTYAYFLAQTVYLQKNDFQQVVDYGQKALQLKSDNLNALMMMATILPQPQLLRNDPDPEKKLNEAEADASKALGMIDQIQKQPSETDEGFQKRKGSYAENVHAALGLIHLSRAAQGLTGFDPGELAKAETEYKAAIAATNDPNPENYFRLGEVYVHEKKTDDAIQAYSKASELGQGTPLKEYADKNIEQLKKGKAASGSAHKP